MSRYKVNTKLMTNLVATTYFRGRFISRATLCDMVIAATRRGSVMPIMSLSLGTQKKGVLQKYNI